MIIRVIGAVMIIAGCTGAGYLFALNVQRESAALRSIISILEYWINELSFHMTPLPELCRQASTMDNTIIGNLFHFVAEKLEMQTVPDAENCILAAMDTFPDFPRLVSGLVIDLSHSLGRFDLDGQLREIESILKEATRLYEQCIHNQEVRLRNYRTLGICAGTAIVILLI